MINQKIREEVKTAMRNKDQIALNTLRGILAAFTNELVAKGKKPQEELSEEEVLSVLKRLAKQRKESIQQFKDGGRNELAEVEEKELEIIKKYLPEEASKEEIRKVAIQKKEELNVTDKSKIGVLVGAVMSQFKNRSDGKTVKEIVESLF